MLHQSREMRCKNGAKRRWLLCLKDSLLVPDSKAVKQTVPSPLSLIPGTLLLLILLLLEKLVALLTS